jgi:hypothetical protein
MTADRENLIEDLVADLKPVHRPGRIRRPLIAWLVIAIVYGAVIVTTTGPLRDGAVHNLVASPPFALETLLAMLAIVSLAHATLRTAIPGEAGPAKLLLWPLLFVGAWVAIYIAGVWHPAHPVSMLGKRDHCVWQTVLFSLPSLGLLLWMARGLLPLWPRTTAMLAGAASAAIPGALMQFACMYAPGHILTHHIGPIFITAAIGGIAGRLVLTRRATVPRSRGVSVH